MMSDFNLIPGFSLDTYIYTHRLFNVHKDETKEKLSSYSSILKLKCLKLYDRGTILDNSRAQLIL